MPKSFDCLTKADTIYCDEAGFDAFKILIDPRNLEFVECLKTSEASSIFHVNYSYKPRVLKVFHNNGDPGYASDCIHDLNRARCEIRAYCRLKQFGICNTGYVPDFYGYMPTIDPARYAPHLNEFLHDINTPSAILIEYLPKPQPLNCVTYTPERMHNAVLGIQQIHSALVEHNDPYPKNILIIPGDPERVMWVDFDVAIVYPVGKRQRPWLDLETEVVESFGSLLVCHLSTLAVVLRLTMPAGRRPEEGSPTKYKVLLEISTSQAILLFTKAASRHCTQHPKVPEAEKNS
ncbi:hypothetical protein LOZ52_001046 [Ophidiomyces ophidiicola]|uniref:Uncharacterized protein n=1 Tax=Ophidiomyces ophidiicola TaxID=1387563 RepID=A0ACB8V3Q6_9EURO|nr:hypothetical protein LOZ64_000979 [Ophidiomyces ophidiicola]KAI1930121.1 hypothetical protein LOZ60_001180 [Ophidiomyces ophidiicola]KAI1965103.1 hypothetical protein LOZ59_001429 [Ophidiomyces ophidiicola]KAI1974289.1 hypothetical protein LOZ56_001291 [Ophidiomyces ophidiicola]KAI2016111.1 hypothetical protein LOZ49_000294 [Ophidiomyces ophidiicola]